MTFADKLRAMKACHEAVEWVGNRTLTQAWNQCERSDWMTWLLSVLRFDTRACAADIAESVWHLVEPESQLACAWAIDCARRGADDDEMAAARDAAWAAARDAAWDAAWAAAGAAWAAAGAAGAAAGAAWAAAGAAGAAARDAAWAAARDAAWDAAGDAQRRLNCAIIREHFTAALIAKRMPK